MPEKHKKRNRMHGERLDNVLGNVWTMFGSLGFKVAAAQSMFEQVCVLQEALNAALARRVKMMARMRWILLRWTYNLSPHNVLFSRLANEQNRWF